MQLGLVSYKQNTHNTKKQMPFQQIINNNTKTKKKKKKERTPAQINLVTQKIDTMATKKQTKQAAEGYQKRKRGERRRKSRKQKTKNRNRATTLHCAYLQHLILKQFILIKMQSDIYIYGYTNTLIKIKHTHIYKNSRYQDTNRVLYVHVQTFMCCWILST